MQFKVAYYLAILVILRSTRNLMGKRSSLLPPDIIDVTRMNNANQQGISNVIPHA